MADKVNGEQPTHEELFKRANQEYQKALLGWIQRHQSGNINAVHMLVTLNMLQIHMDVLMKQLVSQYGFDIGAFGAAFLAELHSQSAKLNEGKIAIAVAGSLDRRQ